MSQAELSAITRISTPVINDIVQGRRGLWDGQKWRDETIQEFRNGIEAIRKAYVYMQRIDWLLSCDDGEDTFHQRLKMDLEEFKFYDFTEESE